MKIVSNDGLPDAVPPPGEMLRESLEALGMSQSELAMRIGRPKKTINEIIKGKAALTPETALQLERALGVPSGFWNNSEFQFREFQAQRQEEERLRQEVEWLNDLPIREMAKFGWIHIHEDKVRQLREVLDFFGVASPEAWRRLWLGPNVAFRRTQAFRNDPALLAGWLRVGEIQAREISCAPFNGSRFEKSLEKIRKLTLEEPSTYRKLLPDICAEAGVALVFLPEPPRLSISGATRWLTPMKALMQISLRYTTDDQFWITFFHEAGHILLHGKRDVFLEIDEQGPSAESAADNFAVQQLLGGNGLDRLLSSGAPNRESLKAHAAMIDLAPGVLVGILQLRGSLAHSEFNDLKRLFRLKEA